VREEARQHPQRQQGGDGDLKAPRELSLEQAIEYIEDDEFVEITPQTKVRLRKRILDEGARRRAERQAKDKATTGAPGPIEFFAPNGMGWLLRAYRSLDALVTLESPDTGGWIKPFPVSWELAEPDFPTHDHVPFNTDEIDGCAEYYETFENVHHSKVGGWPSNVQSDITWAPLNQHPADPEYVFQIDTEPKAGIYWGDRGTAYFGRGTGLHRSTWWFQWQCL
jgi:hypothetical protein